MAGIIYDFIEVLEEEKECYEGLNTLASYTETAVVNKNIEFLQEVVAKEEEFIGRVNLLAKRREALMKDIAMVTGLSHANLTVTEIANKIGIDSELGHKLIILRDGIKEQLELIKKQSELNKQLLTDSLELVDFMVNAIGTTKGYTHVGNYNRPGEEMSIQRQHSIFDQKQ